MQAAAVKLGERGQTGNVRVPSKSTWNGWLESAFSGAKVATCSFAARGCTLSFVGD